MPILGTVASFGLGPDAPTIGTATDGGTGTTATVTYTAPTWAGKTSGSVTYTATSSPGGFTGTGSSPITVSGLTIGTAYTFTVTATTSYGVTGPASAASNSVTPANPITPSMEQIALVTTTATTSFSFTSIPQTYKHLIVRFSGMRVTTAGNSEYLQVRYNSVTSNTYIQYYSHEFGTSISNGVSYAGRNTSGAAAIASKASANSNNSGSCEFIVMNYTDTTRGQQFRFNSWGNFSNTGRTGLGASANELTPVAVNALTFTSPSNFIAGGKIALYGVKG